MLHIATITECQWIIDVGYKETRGQTDVVYPHNDTMGAWETTRDQYTKLNYYPFQIRQATRWESPEACGN